MAKYGSKVAAAALAVLMVTLPQDEGGVKNGVSKPYYDIGGVLTVCYGHTGRDIDPRKLYNQEECNEFLRKDTLRHMERVQSCLQREPTVGQLIAFTSHDFNTGGWCGSRSNREFNAGNDKESCVALNTSPNGSPAWSYVNGKFVKGLYDRRTRERKKCEEGFYEQVSWWSRGFTPAQHWSLRLAREDGVQRISEWIGSGYPRNSVYL